MSSYMLEDWYLIDRDGSRKSVGSMTDFWSKFDYTGQDDLYEEFSLLLVEDSLENFERALEHVASMTGHTLCKVTDDPSQWVDGLFVVQNGSVLMVTEPQVDIDDRYVQESTADALMGLVAANGVLLGNDPSRGTMWAATWDEGAQFLSWYDSTMPGPSHAREYHRNGICIEEDPRTYALKTMRMPSTSPFLNRWAFLEGIARRLPIDRFAADPGELPVLAVYQLNEPEDEM